MKKNRDSSGSCTPVQQAGMGLALLGVVFVVLKGNLMHLSKLRLTPGDGWILVAAVAALIAWPALGDLQQWFHLVGAAFILPSIFAASGSAARRNLPSGEPASGVPRIAATRLG